MDMTELTVRSAATPEPVSTRQRDWTDAVSGLFRDRPRLTTFALLLPGTLWMVIFVGVPLGSIVLFSFWQSGYAGLRPEYTLDNYRSLLTDPTFRGIVVWTLAVVAIVLIGAIAIAYPVAYAIWRVLKSPRAKMAVLLLMIIPFWTSYLTRTITWLPMFGLNGVVNTVLMQLGVISEPLTFFLYSPPAMIVALWFLYAVFIIGPLYWSMSQIDDDIMSAAAVLGAKPWRTFLEVVVPLSRPGLMAGALLTAVFGMGEFFTGQTIGGNKKPMLAQLILNQIYIFQWAAACAIAVLLTIITVLIVVAMLRFFDLRKV
jgi:putative spermidine/putrescine transport system permease protein